MNCAKHPAVVAALILAASGLAFAPARAQSDPATLKRDKFTLKVPSGWSRIPQSDIDEIYGQQKAVAQAARKDIPPLDCGFRIKLADDYPRILVSKSDTGRITEDMLRQIGSKEWDAGLQKGSQTAADHTAVISSVKPGPSTYDPKSQIIWTRTDAQVGALGLLKSVAALKLTETGYVVLGYVAQEKDFEKHLATFTRFAEEMQVDELIRYRTSNKQ